jgi:hypothetical protein
MQNNSLDCFVNTNLVKKLMLQTTLKNIFLRAFGNMYQGAWIYKVSAAVINYVSW